MSSRQYSRQVNIRRKVNRENLLEEPETDRLQHASGNSPPWSNTAKLAVTLSLIAVLAGLVLRFRSMVGVLLMAILLAYLLYPVTGWLRKRLSISWRFAATLVFVVTLLVIFGLLFWGGYTIVTQTQSLIAFIQKSLTNLPGLVEKLPEFNFGNFHFPPANLSELDTLGQDVMGLINPVLSRITSLLTSAASGVGSFIGWTFFTLLIMYFILAESSGIPGQMIRFNVPGYTEDIKKFNRYLSGIWNAFLRGQLIIFAITLITYFILLSILGVRFAIGLALVAGLARFVPYVGPAVAWTSYGLVAFFQGSTPFGLAPIWFVVLVVGVAWITDLIMDNFVATRLMGDVLRIHPAAVMISALVGANLLGVIGVILAAPVVATLKLFLEYIINKLIDRDPWESIKTKPIPPPRSIVQFLRFHLTKIRGWLTGLQKKQKQA